MEIWTAILAAVVTGLVNWGALKVELRWLRRDVDELRRHVEKLERRQQGRALFERGGA